MMARLLCLGLWSLFGCGSAPTSTPDRITPLRAGESVYALRYNPPASLADRPELSTEIQGLDHWERIALESREGEGGLVETLLGKMRERTEGIFRVRGDLKNQTVQWAGGHASRVLVLIELDPPAE